MTDTVRVVPVTSSVVRNFRGEVMGWTQPREFGAACNVWSGSRIVAFGTTREAAEAAARLLGGAW